MSESESSGAGQREVAYRIFAAEFEAADYDYSESDEERAPNYVVTPTGARANRLFIVGVLTEIEQVSEDVLRARVVDQTGAFVLYAGQYQPDEQAFLEGVQPPTFVAVTGKARTFQPEDSEQVFTSIRPESISEVDAETRDRWTVQTAEQTIDRLRWMTTALIEERDVRTNLRDRGADEGLAHGIALALDHYGTTPTYLDALRELSLDAARVVAGEIDEIEEFAVSPTASGDVTATDLAAKLTLPDGSATESSAEQSAADSTDTASSGPETASVDSTESTDSTESSSGEPVTETAEDVAATEEETDEEIPTAEETTETTADEGAAGSDDLGDFESEEFELEDETREEIEEEYGTEFQSGTEVDDPGNADIDPPDPDELDDPEAADTGEPAEHSVAEQTEPESTDAAGDELPDDSDAEAAEETESRAAEEGEAEGETAEASEPDDVSADADAADEESEGTEEVDDPQAAVVDLMGELDDGNGADRAQLLAEMNDRHGVDTETAEEAIQSALMEGQCYEPDDDTLKPI